MTFPPKPPVTRVKSSMWIVRLLRLGAISPTPAWTASGVAAQTPSSTPSLRRVLVLYSDERLLPANIILDEAIRATFAAETSDHIEFHSEFLDVTRFPGEEQQQRQRDFLRDKYRERPPDVVIAVSGAALEFLLKYRAELSPECRSCNVPWPVILIQRTYTMQRSRESRSSRAFPPPWK